MRQHLARQILASFLTQEEIGWLAEQGSDTLCDAAAIVEDRARKGWSTQKIAKWLVTPNYWHGNRMPLVNIGCGYAHEYTNKPRKGSK